VFICGRVGLGIHTWGGEVSYARDRGELASGVLEAGQVWQLAVEAGVLPKRWEKLPTQRRVI